MAGVLLWDNGKGVPVKNQEARLPDNSIVKENRSPFRSKVDMIKTWESLRMKGTTPLLPSIGSLYRTTSIVFPVDAHRHKVELFYFPEETITANPVLVRMTVEDGVSPAQEQRLIRVFLRSVLKEEHHHVERQAIHLYAQLKQKQMDRKENEGKTALIQEKTYQIVITRFSKHEGQTKGFVIELRPA